MASVANAEELDAVTCSVCKDVYGNPVKISCGHSFCEDCINKTWSTSGNQACPICRKDVDGNKDPDVEMIGKMSAQTIDCSKCHKNVILTEYRCHQRTCGSGTESFLNTGPSTSLGSGASTEVNIYTFTCPYCGAKNLDRKDLLKHVLGLHKDSENKNVVCPICKEMPWGNRGQQSADIFEHVKLRHRFDYDRFVDFNQDEETAFQNALEISIDHH